MIQSTHGTSNADMEQTDFLIVGAGPAGAALACFLSEYGLKGIMIAAAPGTADTPRAHITNMAALECLRDIGLQEECLANATASDNMEHTRWCYTMAGEELARIHSWGHDPHRHGDYWDASPCKHVDLPQTLAEPILVHRAKQRGWDVRFSNKLLSFEDKGSDGGVITTIEDRSRSSEYKIHSRYLFGCDGARSQIVRQLGFPMRKGKGGGLALNILVRMDLSHLVKTRKGNLHWIVQPDKPFPLWGQMCILRMVHPWNEWMFIILPHPTWDPTVHGDPTEAEQMARIRDFVGDDTIPAKILNFSKWAINETVAEQYSSPTNTIHCLGDAVHRHPPFNGLGSNTCIQDAYNLAWKIAYVHKNLASPSLLTSYNTERQPVGAGVVTRANDGYRDHEPCLAALGMLEPDLASSTAAFAELKAPTPAGAARRAAFRSAVQGTCHEFHAVGQEMNQRYDGSAAIYFSDEPDPRPPLPADPVLTYRIGTYPGARLPHAWLNRAVPGEPISTQDIAGKGRFTLITGPCDTDRNWARAAEDASKTLGVEVKAVSIGYGCEWDDAYFDWARRREVDDDGAVLVRPDRFVAWRSVKMPAAPGEKLLEVLRSVLGLSGQKTEPVVVNGVKH